MALGMKDGPTEKLKWNQKFQNIQSNLLKHEEGDFKCGHIEQDINFRFTRNLCLASVHVLNDSNNSASQ